MSTDSTTALPGTVPAMTPQDPRAQLPRRADGSVNWRATVAPEHLYVKGEHKETVAKLLNKPVTEIYNLSAEDIAKVPDRYLVIRKAGILALARLRGFVTQVPDVQFAQRDYVIVRTVITWTPFENMPTTSGGVGEACPENTSELGSRYLASNAQNRAFARAVRDYLEIDIVCSDELGKDGQEPESNPSTVNTTTASTTGGGSSGPMDLTPQGILSRHATDAGFTFEQVKKAAQSRWDEDTKALETNPEAGRRIENDPAAWDGWSAVPARDCTTLIALIKAAKKAREEAAQAKAAEAANAATQHVAGSAVSEPAAESSKPKRTRKNASAAPASTVTEFPAAPEQAAA